MPHSQYVIEGQLKPCDNEVITLSTTSDGSATLDAAKHTKSGSVANLVIITLVEDKPILWILQDASTTLPADADEGVRWTQSDGPLVLHCDPTQFRARIEAASGTVAINVNYFYG